MLNIYVDEISERLLYTFQFIFEGSNLTYHFTNDAKYFLATEGKKLNFSERHFDDIPQFIPSTLLFEEEYSTHKVQKSKFEEIDCLTFDGITDPFSSIFYVLSRMEEYAEILRDDHGRFPANQSLQYKYGWTEQLICERWVRAILSYFYKLGVTPKTTPNIPYKFVPSFDIDNTFAYQYKTGLRKFLGACKDILQFKFSRVRDREKVLIGKMKDPFDTFDTILQIANQHPATTVFWHLGNFGKYDKNLSYNHPKHRKLIQHIARKATVGIHPSYASTKRIKHLKEEIERLESIIGRNVTHSRQHFLKLNFPGTYRELIANGIQDDYSLGFTSTAGFRAGTARPFKWFDLDRNHVGNLTIHPLTYMEQTLQGDMEQSPGQAKKKIKQLHSEVQQYGGEFIFLWHNETIGDYRDWKGWKQLLNFTLSLENE